MAILTTAGYLISSPFLTANAKVVDNDPFTEQRWVISEIYLGGDDYKGAYLEIYNNDNNTSLGWKDFVINLPFDIDLPPIYDLHTYKPHAYKILPLDEGWMAWLAKNYLQIMYGDEVFYEVKDSLDELDGYSYQRCQSTRPDGSRVISNKFYYGKKTPKKAILCSDKSITASDPSSLPKPGLCTGLRLNEIGSNLSESRQFIELTNTGNKPVPLKSCFLTTKLNDDKSLLPLDDIELPPGGLYSTTIEGSVLTPLAKTSGVIYVIDSDKESIINYKRYNDAKKNTALALDENGKWQITYRPTPGKDNKIEKYPPCPKGQIRDESSHKCRSQANPKSQPSHDKSTVKACPSGYKRSPTTNRCHKINKVSKLTPCRAGYERNPDTNRCRKIINHGTSYGVVASAGPLPCRAGYEQNPTTNRCVKIANHTSQQPTPCKEGYHRNPATNRCVKNEDKKTDLGPCRVGYERNPITNRCVKKSLAGLSADQDDTPKYPVKPDIVTDNSEDNTLTLYVLLGIIILSCLGILAWQYRSELGHFIQKIKSHRKSKPHQNLSPDQFKEEDNSEWLDKLTKE